MNKNFGLVLIGLLVIGMIYSAWNFYSDIIVTSKNYIPNVYTQQWQKAMSWVRDNTPENAVFGHWWDYGYWVQSIGHRATMLDGGNYIGYWNHLMGRYVLTGTSNKDALDVLYSHNVTHLLIDSTDIGKYAAFSSIGSGIVDDRASYIPTLTKDYTQKKETKNGTSYVYSGGFALDDDIVYQINGTKVFLPKGSAGVLGVLVDVNKDNKITEQPTVYMIYQNKQYALPLRYLYQDKFIDFGNGIEAGIFIYPRILMSGNQNQIDLTGGALYLSNRTVKSQLARLYLYNEDNEYFKLVHSEDDIVVSQVKSMGASNSSFVLYDQFRGPIKIWEVNYPYGMQVNQTYLQTNYPDPRLDKAL